VSTAKIEYQNVETLNLTAGTAANDQINLQLVAPPISASNPGLPAKMSFDGGAGGGDFLTITGTAGADAITVGSAGLAQRSQIELARMEFFKFFGLGGNDSLAAGSLLAGTQTWMVGDAGNDTLVGGRDSDTFEGGIGNDIAFGYNVADLSILNNGEDLLVGGAGEDELHGGFGDDVLLGGPGFDALYGHAGNDFLCADHDVTVNNLHDSA